MSITVLTDVFCDACNGWVHGAIHGSRARVRDARAQARALGWTHSDGRDLCDLCSVGICPHYLKGPFPRRCKQLAGHAGDHQ